MANQVLCPASSASKSNKNSYENTHIFDKTRLCKFYAKGKCKRGQACTFAHGEGEVQQQPDFFRTQLCTDFIRSGACKLGSACSFAHSPQELQRAKTRKSSKGRGLRKAADPAVSLEVHRLEMMQQKAACFPPQHVMLQTIMGLVVPGTACASGSNAPVALDAGTSRSCELTKEQDAKEDSDFLDVTLGISRQSTEEGTELPLGLGRQSTVEADDTWDCLASVACSSEEDSRLPSEAGEEEVVCELLVKCSFISVEPVRVSSRRRTRSAPAARQQKVPQRMA